MKWIGALSRQLGGGGGIRAEDWVCELERERESWVFGWDFGSLKS